MPIQPDFGSRFKPFLSARNEYQKCQNGHKYTAPTNPTRQGLMAGVMRFALEELLQACELGCIWYLYGFCLLYENQRK